MWHKQFECFLSALIAQRFSSKPLGNIFFEEKMTKLKINRRSGVERREFQYTECFPERRNDIDRRRIKKWKRNSLSKIWKYLQRMGKNKSP